MTVKCSATRNVDATREESSIETVLCGQVSAAPEPLRSYIRELERQADPAGNLRELVYARAERQMLGIAVFELKQAIRAHRDTPRSDPCGRNDLALYQIVDEPGGESCPN